MRRHPLDSVVWECPKLRRNAVAIFVGIFLFGRATPLASFYCVGGECRWGGNASASNLSEEDDASHLAAAINGGVVEDDVTGTLSSGRHHFGERSGGRGGDFPGAAAAAAAKRFPRYGTEDYSRRCRWLLDAARKRHPSAPNCTIYHSPYKRSREGISFWTSQVVASHLLAVQAGCRLLVDYGNVKVSDVLIPADPDGFDWSTMPRLFNCKSDPNCYQVSNSLAGKTRRLDLHTTTGRGGLVAPVPSYRYAYQEGRWRFQSDDNFTVDLERSLPGFDVHDGVACSLGTLFRLSPSASRVEPELFTLILPSMQDNRALVIGLYVRTGWSDLKSTDGKFPTGAFGEVSRTDPNSPTNDTLHKFREEAAKVVDAALDIERDFLTKGWATGLTVREFDRIVWFVATDWPGLKEWIFVAYNGTDANASPSTEPGETERSYQPQKSVRRQIVTTRAKGRHTRLSQNPNSADFNEAFLDFYLLGECDIVVKNLFSFADIAALRTAAPLYQNGTFLSLLEGEGDAGTGDALSRNESKV